MRCTLYIYSLSLFFPSPSPLLSVCTEFGDQVKRSSCQKFGIATRKRVTSEHNSKTEKRSKQLINK